jgi:hypothetical protein
MMMRAALRTGAVILAGAWPVPAFACTLCHSEQAAAVRARVLQSTYCLKLVRWDDLFLLWDAVMLMGGRIVARQDLGS